MYPGDIAARLQLTEAGVSPVAATAAIGADPASTSTQRALALVVQKLTGDQFEVLIGARSLQLALPPQTAVGQTVALRRSADGRWLATGAAPANSPVNSFTSAAASQTSMSEAARLVDLLLQATPGSAPPAEDPVPLLPAAPAPSPEMATALPATLATALATALSESGLFYESHLLQWSAGSRSLDAVMREPQSQLDLNDAASTRPAASGAATQPAARAALAPALDPADAAATASVQQAGVHPDAIPMIAQQLNALETGQMTWHGELWPGRSLLWNIARDDGTADDSGNGGRSAIPGTAPKWRTRLAITFPDLGAVSANIALQGNAVWVTLATADPVTQQKLGAGGPALAGAFVQAGLTVHTLQIENEPLPQN
jgi:hypothetical protein